MLTRIRQLLEMIRFSHTLFALPPALLASVMAWSGDPPVRFRWRDLAGILVCMVAARGAAMAFNRLADQRLDAVNPRTQGRHLPTGTLSVGWVALFTAVCALGFVAGTLLFWPNWIPLAASLPVLLFLSLYSYSKRVTALTHFWLGAGLMLAPVGAWVAIRGGTFAWPPVLLGGGVMLWVAGFDMIYACQDVDFDVRMRLRSAPARLGVAGALRAAAVCHLGMIALLLALPLVYTQFGWIYLSGVTAIAVLLVYEHWLVRPEDLSRVERAFFQVNAVVSSGLLVIGWLDVLM
jgi:4-hydroxybenzoate polyprenyltransferase